MRLVILGEGEERPKLERLIEELGMEKDIELPGFVKNPFNYMKQANLFVLSSAWEGLPNVLIQAMACGTPVVSTDCPSGPAEILENGRYGPLVAVGNVETLGDAILATIDRRHDATFCRNLIARSLCFSEDVIVDRYLDILFPARDPKITERGKLRKSLTNESWDG